MFPSMVHVVSQDSHHASISSRREAVCVICGAILQAALIFAEP